MRWLSLVAIVLGFVAGRHARPGPAECAPVVVHDTRIVTVPGAAAAPVVDEVAVSDEEPVEEPPEEAEGTPVDLGSVLSQIAQLEATLATGGALQGRVTDARTSDPMVGATVVAWRPGHEGEQVVITDEQGAYTLTGLVAGMYSVRVYYIDQVTEYSDVAVSSRKVTPLYAKIDVEPPQPYVIHLEESITID